MGSTQNVSYPALLSKTRVSIGRPCFLSQHSLLVVSSDRQTTANQFADVFETTARDDSGRDWHGMIREAVTAAIYEEERPARAGSTRTVYRIRPEVAAELARGCIYIEQARSGKAGAARRPLFEQMKRDAAGRKFSRLLVWKVSRLGRDWKSSGDAQGKPN